MSKFKAVSDVANIIDLGTDLVTTWWLYSSTERAKNTLLISSIAMSVLALTTSIYQTRKIMNEIEDAKCDVGNKIARYAKSLK